MNPKFFRYTILILVLLLAFAITYRLLSSHKPEPDPKRIEHNCDKLSTYPGFSIYKTNEDYFDNVLCSYRNSKIQRIPMFNIGDCLNYFTKDTIYKCRIKLSKGYVLDKGCSCHDVFLDISIKDYYKWELENNATGMPRNMVSNLILDKDPFKEFWYVKNSEKGNFTIKEIETLIANNKLEAYFKRLK